MKRLLPFGVILVWVLFVYRGLWDQIPRSDHLYFLRERDLVGTDAEWFWHGLNYNRTRVLTGGAHYLFRPIMKLQLVVQDLLFREHSLVIGLASLGLHALTSFTLFRLLKRVAPVLVATAATLAFSTQWAGIEMVLWRHISPYMWALVFLGAGLSTQRSTLRWILLTLACLSHESVVVVLAALVGFLAVSRQFRDTRNGAIRGLLSFATLDLAQWVVFPNPTITDPAHRVLPEFSPVLDSLHVLGATAMAQLRPDLVMFHWMEPYGRLMWDFTPLLGLPLLVTGGMALVLMLGGVLLGWAELRKGHHRGLLMVVFSLHPLLLLAAFVGARVATRGLDYLTIATYYFYFIGFAFFVLVGSLLVVIPPRMQRLAQTGFVGVCLLWTVFSWVGIRGIARGHQPVLAAVNDTAETVRNTVAPFQARGGCYGGALDPLARSVHPGVEESPLALASDVACTRGRTQGWYLGRQQEQWVLGHRPTLEWAPVALSTAGSPFRGDRLISYAGSGAGEVVSLFGESNAAVQGLRVEVHHPMDGGIWLGHPSSQHYITITMFKGQHIEARVRQGPNKAETVFRRMNVITDQVFTLSVERIGGRTFAFYNQELLGELPALELDGRVGIFHRVHGAQEPQSFASLQTTHETGILQAPNPVALPGLDHLITLTR